MSNNKKSSKNKIINSYSNSEYNCDFSEDGKICFKKNSDFYEFKLAYLELKDQLNNINEKFQRFEKCNLKKIIFNLVFSEEGIFQEIHNFPYINKKEFERNKSINRSGKSSVNLADSAKKDNTQTSLLNFNLFKNKTNTDGWKDEKNQINKSPIDSLSKNKADLRNNIIPISNGKSKQIQKGENKIKENFMNIEVVDLTNDIAIEVLDNNSISNISEEVSEAIGELVKDKSKPLDKNSMINKIDKNLKNKHDKYHLNKNQIIFESSNEMEIESNININKNKENDVDISISDESSLCQNFIAKDKIENLKNLNKKTKDIDRNSDNKKNSSGSVIQINAEKSNLNKKELDEKVNNFNQKFFDYKNFNSNKANLANSNLNSNNYLGGTDKNSALPREIANEETFDSNAVGVKRARRNWIKKDQITENNKMNKDDGNPLNFNFENENLITSEVFNKDFDEKKLLDNNNNYKEYKNICSNEKDKDFKFISNINTNITKNPYGLTHINLQQNKISNNPFAMKGTIDNLISNETTNNNAVNSSFTFNQNNKLSETPNFLKSNTETFPIANNGIIKNNKIINEVNINMDFTQNSSKNNLEFENEMSGGNFDICNNFKNSDKKEQDKTILKKNEHDIFSNKSTNINENMNKNKDNLNDIDFDLLENELDGKVYNKQNKGENSYELKFQNFENSFDEFYGMKIINNNNRLISENSNLEKFGSDANRKIQNNKSTVINETVKTSIDNTNNFRKSEKTSVIINLNNSNHEILKNLSNNQSLTNKRNTEKLNYKNESNKDVSEDELIFKRSGKNGIIRNKKDREQLKGFNCEICEEFYEDFDETENPELKNLCSRHRCLENPNRTPKEFYDINI